ncbi:MAG: DUF3830 family protein [Alphaproteobacteria bacterium]|nr:DUF3830 family protein [Alphaproteobacteria bacterium]
MAKLEFTMARGGVFVADIFVAKVPQTWNLLSAFLPRTIKGYNARWSGRETHTPLALPHKPPRENQTSQMGIGDVLYGREWEDRDYTGFEAIGWFYAAEVVRDWRGPHAVNHIGRVRPQYWPLIEEVGLRIWREGGEDCTLQAIE